jgi:hypothetical protein
MYKLKKEELKPYIIARRLRDAANRCTRINSDVAILCEHALAAAKWMESEADDIAKMAGSVTHDALMGRMTPGCIVREMRQAQSKK